MRKLEEGKQKLLHSRQKKKNPQLIIIRTDFFENTNEKDISLKKITK